jgi:hypothetical protein
MKRSQFLSSALILIATAVGASLHGQTGKDAQGNRVKVIPPARDPFAETSFAVNSRTAQSPLYLEIRSASEMTQQDRDVEADAESSIRERAGFEALGFNEGDWSYQQLVCPTFPNHVLLRFSRNNGVGDVSMFSASIPKSGEGRVRIIPILRRGYSLFSPAPINALTISAFNHIRAEESGDKSPDWVMTGLCYAALAGANPKAAFVANDPGDQVFPAAMSPVLDILKDGGSIIRFVNLDSRPMEWNMTFNAKGKLIKATHSAPTMITAKAVPPTVTNPKGRPLAANIDDTKAITAR